MTQNTVVMQAKLPAMLEDAIVQMLGKPGRKFVRDALNDVSVGSDLAKLEDALLRAFVYALPKVSNTIHNYAPLKVLDHFQETVVHNPFLNNPHACGITATLISLARKEPDWTGRELAQKAVAHYVAWSTEASYTIRTNYAQLLKLSSGDEGDRTNAQRAEFVEIFTTVKSAMASDSASKIANGFSTLLDALLILREKREEEATLTVDLKLPLSCSWDLAHEFASKSSGAALERTNLQALQGLLASLGGDSIDKVVSELEKAGRWARRGVCQFTLRGQITANEGMFAIERIWRNHDGAPLSQLYGFDWALPKHESETDLRLVLLDNTAISIQCQGDPLFEFLLGTWSLVDLQGKMQSLAQCLPSELSEKPHLEQTLFRIARFAYQLGYHNHGANIALHLEGPNGPSLVPEKLPKFHKWWTPVGLPEARIPITATGANEASDDHDFGRLAYSLSLQDGMSLWKLDAEAATFQLVDFGKYVNVSNEHDINPFWDNDRNAMGLDLMDSLGGGRHRAAYAASKFRDGNRAIVFCVSQDGYIEVFVDGLKAKLR